VSEATKQWFGEGLRFRCTRCGNCCRGAGNVWIGDAEIHAIAGELGMPEEEFRAVYTRRAARRGLVLRQKRNQDCIFWNPEAGCEVYAERPRQCRTYPFWSANVHSRENWEAEARSCPGIGSGDLHPASEVAATAADDGIPTHRTRMRVDG
jgi:Fe-S-cluster containining protein